MTKQLYLGRWREDGADAMDTSSSDTNSQGNTTHTQGTSSDSNIEEYRPVPLDALGQYQVLKYLGSGDFGKVAKCVNRQTKEIVAIKFLKKAQFDTDQGQMEVNILSRLSDANAEQHNIVRFYGSFLHRNKMCLVFEMLELSLYDYMKNRDFLPLPLKWIRPILQQLLEALFKLKELGIVHADLKPENVMVRSGQEKPCRVKIIDFGCSCHNRDFQSNTYIQSRHYRAPEIILGLPFSEAIDMWSLGCVAAELFLGWSLYPGFSEHQQIKFIMEMQGPLANDMLSIAPKTTKFFSLHIDDGHPVWFLKANTKDPDQRPYTFLNLNHIADFNMPHLEEEELKAERIDRKEFVDLLKAMLLIDPVQRTIPGAALNHPFLRLDHLYQYYDTATVIESRTIMVRCERYKYDTE